MSAKVLLTESMSMEMGAQEPWPSDVQLFQPYEVEQILLPDNATCLAVQAFLHMCNLDFTIEMRPNAENMSPSGKVPFVKVGNHQHKCRLSNSDDFTGRCVCRV